MRPTLVAAVLLLVTALACSQPGRQGSWSGTLDTTASGAVVVRNTGRGLWDSASAWRLEEELRIGSADDSGAGALSNPRALEVDGAGRIYVIENRPMELRVYAPDGRYLRTLMRTGSGPGEVQQAIGLAWDRAGHLWVVDQQNTRYTVFDTAGARLAEHRRPVSGFFTWQWGGAITRAGEVIEITGARRTDEFRQVAVRLDSALAVTDTLQLPYWKGPVFEIRREGMHASYSVPFAPSLLWRLDRRGYIWSSITDRYRIVQQSLRGDTLRIIEREEVEPVPVTAAEKDSGIAGMRYAVQQGVVVDRSKIPDAKPPITQFWLDDQGDVWTRRSQRESARSTLFDVFDPDGRFLGEVAAPLEFQTVLIRGAALYAVATVEEVPVIVRFRIRGR